MSADVSFAAMMPAIRADCSGSPFFTAPLRMRLRALADIAIDPRATASRAVTGFSPTSTIFTRPRSSTCVSVRCPLPDLPDPPAFLLTALSLRQKEREALQRHREIDALQLDVVGHLERAGRKVEDGLDAGG